ncbi:MAG: DMT family transporter [Lysobacterales bacterium]
MSGHLKTPGPEPADNGAMIWVICVALGAFLLSAKGIVAKLMYAQGADATMVASVRSVIAIFGFWGWAVYKVGLKPMFAVNPRHVAIAMVMGFLSYYVGAYVDFYALTLIDASLERVILFSYPILIVSFEVLRTRRLPSAATGWSLLLTYLGVMLAVGAFDGELLKGNLLGAGLVMIAAVGVAAFYLINGRYGPLMGSLQFTTWAMTAAGLGFAAHFLINANLSDLAQQTATFWWLMALMVIGVTVLPLVLMGQGVAKIGATRGGMISTLGPAATVMMAWLILGEAMHPLQLAGSAMIVLGVWLLERKKSRA